MPSQQGTSRPWPQIFEHFSSCQTTRTKYIQLKKYLTYFLGSTAVFISRYVYCSVCKLLKAQNVPGRLMTRSSFPSRDSEYLSCIFLTFYSAALGSFGLNQFHSHKGRYQHKELFFFVIMSADRVKNRFNCNSQHLCVSGGAGEDKRKRKKTRCVC